MVLEANFADGIPAAVDQDRVLPMEQESVRIPSYTFEEDECADYLGRVMGEIGLEVEMMEVGGCTTMEPSPGQTIYE